MFYNLNSRLEMKYQTINTECIKSRNALLRYGIEKYEVMKPMVTRGNNYQTGIT